MADRDGPFGATSAEIEQTIQNCDLSIKLSDGRKKIPMAEVKAVKAALLWVTDAVKNPHPLE